MNLFLFYITALAQFDLDLHFIEEPPSAFGTLGKNYF